MFTPNEKTLPKWCFLTLLTLLICDFSLSVKPRIESSINLKSEEPIKHSLENVTKINTPMTKKKCTLADGMSYSCLSDVDEQENRKKSNSKEIKLNSSKENDKINVTKMNTLKKNYTENELINKSTTNLPRTFNNSTTQVTETSTTENAEIASMTDHAHKYTGGIDVDELKPTNSNNQYQNISFTNETVKNESFIHSENKSKNSVVDVPTSGDHVEVHESLMKKMQTTTAAGIAAGICILFAASAYISLMLWKKISYKRYGNREMLLNEDDLGEIHDEDMRHFELKLLDKDGKVIET